MAKREYLTAPLPSEKMPPASLHPDQRGRRTLPFLRHEFLPGRLMTQNLMGQTASWCHDRLNPPASGSTCSRGPGTSWRSWGRDLRPMVSASSKTIFRFSLVYWRRVFVHGHCRAAIGFNRRGFDPDSARCSGIIKPCVSCNVRPVRPSNKHLIQRVFSGSTSRSTWVLPSRCVSARSCWRVGANGRFGVPGISMVIATTAYWRAVAAWLHIPPQAPKSGTKCSRGNNAATWPELGASSCSSRCSSPYTTNLSPPGCSRPRR